MSMSVPSLPLSSGAPIPILGFGVYQADEPAVACALKVGYRHIDTAEFYENEAAVGRALQESGLAREHVFITTKLWIDGHGRDTAVARVKASLKKLGLAYVDLYLIHAPSGGKIIETYDALLELQREGLIRAVGVSNFGVQHLEGIRRAGRPLPAVNQVELHPFLQQREIVAYCKQHGIVVEAYSPLGKGRWLNDAKLKEIAVRAGRSVAQVLIRWSLQHGYVCLPKSSTPARIEENFHVLDFELSAADMAALDGLDAGRHCTWDPTVEPWSG